LLLLALYLLVKQDSDRKLLVERAMVPSSGGLGSAGIFNGIEDEITVLFEHSYGLQCAQQRLLSGF